MKYKTEHGHCNIPQWFIGEVATRQREVYRKGKISEERVQKLDHLGFDWTDLRARFGDCGIPQRQG